VRARSTTTFVSIVAIFSALTAVTTYFTGSFLPSPTGGYTHVGDTFIYLAALLFGRAVGAAVGVIGPLVADLIVGYPRWYVSIVAHGLQGYLAGFGRGRRLPAQVALMFAAGLVMSLTYFAVNIYVKGLAPALVSLARDVFGQTLFSVILAVLLLKPLEGSQPIKAAQQLLARGERAEGGASGS